jgi:hypothetical protein
MINLYMILFTISISKIYKIYKSNAKSNANSNSNNHYKYSLASSICV